MRQCEIHDDEDEMQSLGPVTLQSLGRRRRLGMAARVGPAVRELAEGEIELRERESRSEGED